jgi:hypothetical protein
MSGNGYYFDGRVDGRAATLSAGGARGAEWHADAKGLSGEARSEYIDGFNDVLDEEARESKDE